MLLLGVHIFFFSSLRGRSFYGSSSDLLGAYCVKDIVVSTVSTLLKGYHLILSAVLIITIQIETHSTCREDCYQSLNRR